MNFMTKKDFLEIIKTNKNELPIDIKLLKKYCPLFLKRTITRRIMDEISSLDLDNTVDVMYKYELVKTKHIIGFYVDVDLLDLTEEEYDLIMGEKFFIAELEYNSDYSNFNSFVDKCSGIESYGIIEKINLFLTTLPNGKEINEMTEAFNNIPEETIEKLSSIIKMNDPISTEVSKIIKLDAVEQMNKKERKEEKENIKQ